MALCYVEDPSGTKPQNLKASQHAPASLQCLFFSLSSDNVQQFGNTLVFRFCVFIHRRVNRAFFSNVYLKSLSSADRPSSVITLPSTSQPEFLSKTQSSSHGLPTPLSLEDIEHEASIRAFEDDSDEDSDSDGSDTADGGSESNSELKDDMSDAEEGTSDGDLKPLGPDLVTLSTLPASMWQTLSQFDLIKVGFSAWSCLLLLGWTRWGVDRGKGLFLLLRSLLCRSCLSLRPTSVSPTCPLGDSFIPLHSPVTYK